MSDTLPPLPDTDYTPTATLCHSREQMIAYAAAAVAAEREHWQHVAQVQQASYEREIAIEVAAERERIAALLDAEHERRKHIDNHAAFYARMIREQA
jgi:acyl-CoA reductase-like NAD-dependent aldehyde dehydrogenase